MLFLCCFCSWIFAVFHEPLLLIFSQAILVRALLEYSQSPLSSWRHGLPLAAGLFLTELIRSWSLALMWAVNYRTAARLRGAALTFAFQKILRLRSTKDITPGEVGDPTQKRISREQKGAARLHVWTIEMDLFSTIPA